VSGGPAARPLRIGVIGSSSVGPEEADAAREVGERVAAEGAVLVCGGLGGVMAAAARGASRRGGVVIGVLPGTDAASAAAGVSIPIATGLGEARNVIIARASEAVVAIAGAWGTLSEAAFCRRFGTPVVALLSTLPEGVADEVADSPAAAVSRAVELAKARREVER
jgi:uncharacterized protein (TIGR00725 family)